MPSTDQQHGHRVRGQNWRLVVIPEELEETERLEGTQKWLWVIDPKSQYLGSGHPWRPGPVHLQEKKDTHLFHSALLVFV